jgi:hypothetical protein
MSQEESRLLQAGFALALLRRYCDVVWMPWDPDHYYIDYIPPGGPGEEVRAVVKHLKPEILGLLRQEHIDRKAARARRRH